MKVIFKKLGDIIHTTNSPGITKSMKYLFDNKTVREVYNSETISEHLFTDSSNFVRVYKILNKMNWYFIFNTYGYVGGWFVHEDWFKEEMLVDFKEIEELFDI